MSTKCELLRTLVADEGASALQRDKDMFAHFLGCEDCYQFVQAIAELDTVIANIQPEEAPESTVQALLQKVESLTDDGSEPVQASAPAQAPVWVSMREALAGLPIFPRIVVIGILVLGAFTVLKYVLGLFTLLLKPLGIALELIALPLLDSLEGALGALLSD